MPQNQWLTIGLLLVFIGIAIIIISSVLGATRQGKSDVKVGVVGFLGPIPFGFGSDKRTLLFTVILAAVFFVFSLIWLLRVTRAS